jgi:hypothetical protein
MKKHRLISIVSIAVILLLAISSTGCTEKPASHGVPVTDYVSLVDTLRAAGATVEPKTELEQPFFSVKGQMITVNGNDVQVYEYQDADAADAEAQLVSPDGSTVGTTKITFVAPPHYYKAGKLIVLYVGQNGDLLDLLEDVLGSPFASR